MNLFTKKTFVAVLFLFFFSSLVFPLSIFGICNCDNPNYHDEIRCREDGYQWTCKCTTDGEHLYDVGFAFCYTKGNEILTCDENGEWSETPCLAGCNSGSKICNSIPIPKKECTEINSTKCSETGRESCICKAYNWKCTECKYGCNNGSCKVAPVNNSANSQELDISAPSDFESLGKLTLDNAIPSLINVIYIISSLTFFFILISGGLKWLTSGGDEKKLASARSQITHGLVGLGIVFFTWAFTTLIGQLFGFEISDITIFKSFHQTQLE